MKRILIIIFGLLIVGKSTAQFAIVDGDTAKRPIVGVRLSSIGGNVYFRGVTGPLKMLGLSNNIDWSSIINKPTSAVGFGLTSGLGVRFNGSVVSSKLMTDTLKDNDYHLALIDGLLKVVPPVGQNVSNLYLQNDVWALQSTIIDSLLSVYTINNVGSNYLTLTGNSGDIKIYTSSRHYYFPKKLEGYTITLNLPDPTLVSNQNFGFSVFWNTKNTINFNHPIFYKINYKNPNNTVEELDVGFMQMNPTIQTIPTINTPANWFFTQNKQIRVFYVHQNKWFIQ
jgi:hypothetical protein